MDKSRSRILIIDDTPANIQILYELFSAEYEVFFATSGVEGVAVARRELPDLVLLDIMMPGMDGYEVCRALKHEPATASIPVIFVTAMAEEEDQARGLAAGAVDYITKPIRPSIVRARVRNHLELKHGRDRLEQVGLELSLKNQTLERERSLAHRLLEHILTKRLELDGYGTAVYFRPSDQIGGDFYDAWSDGERAQILIGDISGHSISAALLMAVCKGLFMALRERRGPVAMVSALNQTLCPMLMESGMYLTLVCLLCDRRQGTVTVVSAGHHPFLLFSREGRTLVESTGPPVGWDPEDCWCQVELPFAEGDTLLLYTDGLVEAASLAGVAEESLLAGLDGQLSPAELVTRAVASARAEGGRFQDDVTVLAVRNSGHGWYAVADPAETV
jgi:sigma-B regulation protein RsbU (phosphoserine phosphatase)